MVKENYQIEFGKRLKFYREKAHLSQDELARVCGYSDRSAITKIEKGERDLRIDKLKPICFALGVSPMVFFEDKYEENNILDANLLSIFHQLSERGKDDILYFAESQLQRELKAEKKEGKDQPAASEE